MKHAGPETLAGSLFSFPSVAEYGAGSGRYRGKYRDRICIRSVLYLDKHANDPDALIFESARHKSLAWLLTSVI